MRYCGLMHDDAGTSVDLCGLIVLEATTSQLDKPSSLRHRWTTGASSLHRPSQFNLVGNSLLL